VHFLSFANGWTTDRCYPYAIPTSVFFFPSSRTSRFYERVGLKWHHLLLSQTIPATVSIPGLSLHTLCSRSNPDGTCSVAAGTSSALFDNSAQERVQPRSHFNPFPCQPPLTRLTEGKHLQPILFNIVRSRTSSARVTFRPLLHSILYQSARRPRYQTVRRKSSLFNNIRSRTSGVWVTFSPLLHPVLYQSPRRPRYHTVGGNLPFLILSTQNRAVRGSHLGPSCTHSF